MKIGDLIKNRRTGQLAIVYDFGWGSQRQLLVRVYYEDSPPIWVRAANFLMVRSRGSSAKGIVVEN